MGKYLEIYDQYIDLKVESSTVQLRELLAFVSSRKSEFPDIHSFCEYQSHPSVRKFLDFFQGV